MKAIEHLAQVLESLELEIPCDYLTDLDDVCSKTCNSRTGAKKECWLRYAEAMEKQEQDRWRPCNEKPEYDFQNVLVRWHDKRKGCEKDYYIFEGYVVRGIWCGMFEDADISDFEPIEWKPLEPYTEEES